MYILEENSLQEIYSLPNVQVRVVNESSSYTLTWVHAANVERSNHASNGRLQEGKINEKFLKRLIVGVAYKRWSLAIGSDYRTLTGKSLVFWRGSRLRQVVAHGVSTILWFCTLVWNNRFRSFVGNLFIKHLFNQQPAFRDIEVIMTDVFFIKTSYYCLLTKVQSWCDPHFLGVNRA